MVVRNHFHSRRYQFMKEIRLLTKDDIEVKVKKVLDGKALLLLYKTARVDMAILDEVFGVFNWCNEYKEIKGNMYCGVGVRESADQDFIWKWDCGIESREDEEGNQKKGEASDAFKRACFKVGIGRELYSAPVIYIKAETKQDGKVFKLTDKYAKYTVKDIQYNENREITKLVIVDRKGVQVFPVNKVENTPEPKVENKQPAITGEKLKERKQRLQDALANSTIALADVKKWAEIKSKQKIEPEQLSDELFEALIQSITKPEHQKNKEETPPDDDILN